MVYPTTRYYLKLFERKNLTSFVITGTKGKTLVSLLLSHLLSDSFSRNILIDTTGVYDDGVMVSTGKESKKNFSFTPSVMPGRYLYNLFQNESKKSRVAAVLESSLSCGVYGTGLKQHDVGILTNIYEDHIDNKLIRDREDLYELKAFVFREIKIGGKFITSLDDQLTLKSLSEPVLKQKKIMKIGTTLKKLSLNEHQKIKRKYDLYDIYYLDNNLNICSLSEGLIYNQREFPYFFGNETTGFTSSNLMDVLAALGTLVEKKEIQKKLEYFRYPASYGRQLFFKKENRILVVDYAHEPESLRQLISGVNFKFNDTSHLITRISPNRSDFEIKKFAKLLGKLPISGISIFDKVDGISSKAIVTASGHSREAGESAMMLYNNISFDTSIKINKKVILQEEKALEDAIKSDHKLIVHIVNNVDTILSLIKRHNFKRFL